jgi:hypothetical protein
MNGASTRTFKKVEHRGNCSGMDKGCPGRFESDKEVEFVEVGKSSTVWDGHRDTPHLWRPLRVRLMPSSRTSFKMKY